jgi:hypothetical protein
VTLPERIREELKETAARAADNGNGEGRLDPVLITGMHNSGTSILAEIVQAGGIFLGNGMHHNESRFFSILVNDWLIMRGPEKWAELPLMDIEQVRSCKDSAGRFVLDNWLADYLHQGYDGSSRWGFKDPRLCVLMPLYLDLFPEATVVHIRRNPDDVAASLCRRAKRGVGVSDDFEHWRELAAAYTERMIEYSGKCRSYYELNYEGLCTDPEGTLIDLFEFLKLEFSGPAETAAAKVTAARIGSAKRRETCAAS